MDGLTVGLAAASGALVGFLLALFGGGGSVLATPLLVYLVGIRDPHVAIGTSAAAVCVNALISLVGHGRAGRVKWSCAAAFAGIGLVGSIVGAAIAKQVDGRRLLAYFAVVMVIVAISMLRPPRDAADAEVRLTGKVALKLAPLALAAGLMAGFFGIGGGFMIVAGLIAATAMPLANAAASSLVAVTLFSGASAATYAASGLVDWPIAAAFALGGLPGAMAGHALCPLLVSHVRLARRLFAGLILAVAAYVAWRAL